MSIQIRIPGASFTKTVAKLGMPHIDLLQDYFLFGGNQAASIANQVSTGSSGVMTGSPTFGAGYATLDSTNFLSSAVANSTPVTFLTAFRKTSGAKSFFGNYNGTSGIFAYTQDNNNLYSFLGATQTGAVNFPAGFVSTVFYVAALTYDGANVNTYLFTGGATPLSSRNAQTGVLAALAARWGGWASSGGSSDYAAGAVAANALTQQQLVDIYNYWKPFLASRGITVV